MSVLTVGDTLSPTSGLSTERSLLMSGKEIYEKISVAISFDTTGLPEIPGLRFTWHDGEQAYRKVKGKIDTDELNVLVLSEGFNVLGTFWHGFFSDLRKSMSPGEIREHFLCDDPSFRHYMDSGCGIR